VRKFILDYFFEERQNLRFDMYDLDSKSNNLSKHDFLGQATCSLGEIVGSLGSRLEKPLTAEELSNCRESVMLQFCGNKLDKKDFFGKSDPFLVFFRSNEDGSFTICHKTEVVKNTLDPVWQAFKIPVRALCNGDYDRSIKVEVYDWDRDGGHDFIGEFSTSYREMCRSQSQFHVYEPDCSSSSKYSNSGSNLCILQVTVTAHLSHYMSPYCSSSSSSSSSNSSSICVFPGNPSQPTSLHYMSPYFCVVSRAERKLQNPYCAGIEGVLEAYYQSLKTVRYAQLYKYASAVTDGSQYFILLILSDGVITDMAQTKESIVNAASLPMSIIIVGVGPAEFDEMIELDGDEERISSQGRAAERDIVQFVPFRDYVDRRGNHILSMARLAKEVLAEIPDQFLSYMRTRGIKPGPQPPPYSPCSPPPLGHRYSFRYLY
uniref:C2 domain-containing protein n=1 Tax=Neogobius melanostomus TaxID=47308 RepID=A0A8C6T5H5_9GOBI